MLYVRRFLSTFVPVMRSLCVLAVLVMAMVPARAAHAGGTLSVTNASPEERDGRWKLDFKINLGRAPEFVHVGMVFEFTPVFIYERYLDEKTGDKPAVAKRQPQDTSVRTALVDVGFGGRDGKIFPLTKFDLVIKRDRGFEAGEYDLVVKRDDDRSQVGQKVHLKLLGDNPIVDRRPMNFAPEKKPAKATGTKAADAAKEAAKSADAKEAEGADDDDASKDKTESSEDAEEDRSSQRSAAAPPPPVPPRQGACGCRVAGEPASGLAASVGLALLGAMVTLRRRARSGPEL